MTATMDRPARVGVITDQSGALSFMGIANVNVARMVIDDINSRGGLLGRPLELFLEDSATDDDVAQASAARLVEADVDVVVGGIYSSTRQAIKVPSSTKLGSSTCIRSNTRARSATRSSSAPGQCRPSRSTRSSPG